MMLFSYIKKSYICRSEVNYSRIESILGTNNAIEYVSLITGVRVKPFWIGVASQQLRRSYSPPRDVEWNVFAYYLELRFYNYYDRVEQRETCRYNTNYEL